MESQFLPFIRNHNAANVSKLNITDKANNIAIQNAVLLPSIPIILKMPSADLMQTSAGSLSSHSRSLSRHWLLIKALLA